jgi:hypothetical protein
MGFTAVLWNALGKRKKSVYSAVDRFSSMKDEEDPDDWVIDEIFMDDQINPADTLTG